MMIEMQESWMKPILEYIQNGVSSKNLKERCKLQRRATKFCMINNNLYRKFFIQPFLKCLRVKKVEYVKVKIHKGCCDNILDTKLW